MKNVSFSLGFKAGAGLFLMLLAGCAGNAPSRYYVLNSLPGESKVQGTAGAPCLSVGIGPVKLPEYVNRLQIVSRPSPNELALSSFDLWAEPLADSVPRILGENISRLVCAKEIVLFPWKPSRTPEYRLEMEVLSMDGNPGRTVSLEVWWSISSGAEKRPRVTRKSMYSAPVGGQNHEALVQAHSQTLASFSRDIAGALRELVQNDPPGK